MIFLFYRFNIDRLRELEILAESIESDILFRFFKFLIFLFSIII